MILIQPKYTQPEVWETLAEKENLGYEVLELGLPPVLGSEEAEEACLAWYRESGRTLSVHGMFIGVDPASSDSAVRELSRRRCEQSVRHAMALGVKNIVQHSSAFPVLRGQYLEHWSEVCAEYYCDLTERYPIRLSIENSADLDPEPIRKIMERAANPQRIGVCLDVGHANFSAAPIERWFDELGEWITELHLSDNMGLFDEHLPLGKGSVDWEKVDGLWRALGRDVLLTLEVGGYDGVETSLAYLKENGLFLQGGN